MAMDEKRFREHLLIFGADLIRWPEELREEGKESLAKYPGLQALLNEHESFERILEGRKFEEPGGDLAERIISASLRMEEKVPFRFGAYVAELLGEFALQKPAYAVVSLFMIFTLITGFAIGYTNPLGLNSTEGEQTNLQEYLYYEGEAG
jgi:hypothetical protein